MSDENQNPSPDAAGGEAGRRRRHGNRGGRGRLRPHREAAAPAGWNAEGASAATGAAEPDIAAEAETSAPAEAQSHETISPVVEPASEPAFHEPRTAGDPHPTALSPAVVEDAALPGEGVHGFTARPPGSGKSLSGHGSSATPGVELAATETAAASPPPVRPPAPARRPPAPRPPQHRPPESGPAEPRLPRAFRPVVAPSPPPPRNVPSIAQAIEDVYHVIETLQRLLEELDEVLETLEVADRQRLDDTRELDKLRQALRQLQSQRPRESAPRPQSASLERRHPARAPRNEPERGDATAAQD